MDRKVLAACLDKTLQNMDESLLREAGVEPRSLIRGKVRDILDYGDKLLILATDRISAFDIVLATIPCKGEVLNRISLFWFEQTKDIIQNHVLDQLSPRSVLAKKCSVLPIEVVIRGYITGSAWRSYKEDETVSGIRLKSGLRLNEKLAKPLLTPSTKEEKGHHDLPISREQIIAQQVVPEQVWNQVEQAAHELYRRGSEIVGRQGLILVDTKYEFGLADGELYLIDEIHTPDSSRFWYADSYRDLFSSGKNQRELDKEYFRRWLMDRGYMGEGEPPTITDGIRIEVAERYIGAFEEITGEVFVPAGLAAVDEAHTIANNFKQH